MNDKAIQKWARVKAKGRADFVMKYGVLGWGVSTGLVFALFMGWRDGIAVFPIHLLLSLILFPAGGYLWGRFMWWFQNCLYGKSPESTAKS